MQVTPLAKHAHAAAKSCAGRPSPAVSVHAAFMTLWAAPLLAQRTCPTALTPLSVRAARIQCSCGRIELRQQACCRVHHNTEHSAVNEPDYQATQRAWCACKHYLRHGQHSNRGRRATAGPPSYTRAHPHLRRRWPPPRAARGTARPRCSWPPGCAACPANKSIRKQQNKAVRIEVRNSSSSMLLAPALRCMPCRWQQGEANRETPTAEQQQLAQVCNKRVHKGRSAATG